VFASVDKSAARASQMGLGALDIAEAKAESRELTVDPRRPS
jgi:hypothetical protein